ncbi:MAG TPA: PH domain-containing protein [Feifaniaceae bacterium]|nr:PH domain-containing protein [Feifaniaceae bacterium]
MAKQPFFDEISEERPLWHDRKRILGMPLSFTVYEVDKDRFTTRKGLFRTETNEILLYRILDIRLVRTLWQKIFGVGTITLYSADQTHETLELKNIAKPEAVRKFLSRIIEKERVEKGLTGREIYGAAGLMQDGGAVPDASFADVDGDGIPD